jgi:hypothetical protein
MTPKHRIAEGKLGAGAAGAGGGTLLVLLADNLPENSRWKSWLVIIAPSATVFTSILWLWIRNLLGEFMRRRETTLVITEAKVTLERAMKNPLTSQRHREILQRKYEELELLEINGLSQRLQMSHAPRIAIINPETFGRIAFKQLYILELKKMDVIQM